MNPFMAAAAPVETVNPFLAAPAPAQGYAGQQSYIEPQAHVAPQTYVEPPAYVEPQIAVEPQARGDRGDRGVSSYRGDAHAEFRKGNWKKPVALLGAAAAAVAALVFLLPKPEETAALTSAKTSRDAAVIGASVSPMVIADPDADALAKANRAAAQPEPVAGSTESSANQGSNGDFASAFKSAAR